MYLTVKEVKRMNPLAYFRIFDNENCPCGSGKKFKECCKGKSDQEPAQSKKPPEVQVMEQMRKSMVKCCMHPDKSNCKGKIKNAHALQNNKIISLLAGTYNGIETCVITIPERIKFANYAFIAPDYDLNGKRIKHTIKGVMHRIAITAFPEDKKSYILLSCLSSEKNIYAKFFEQIDNASLEKIKFYFSMMLPLYSENMVISPALWNKWDVEIKMAFTFYANLKGQTFKRYSIAIGMGLKNAVNSKIPFDYSKRGKIDLFAK